MFLPEIKICFCRHKGGFFFLFWLEANQPRNDLAIYSRELESVQLCKAGEKEKTVSQREGGFWPAVQVGRLTV